MQVAYHSQQPVPSPWVPDRLDSSRRRLQRRPGHVRNLPPTSATAPILNCTTCPFRLAGRAAGLWGCTTSFQPLPAPLHLGPVIQDIVAAPTSGRLTGWLSCSTSQNYLSRLASPRSAYQVEKLLRVRDWRWRDLLSRSGSYNISPSDARKSWRFRAMGRGEGVGVREAPCLGESPTSLALPVFPPSRRDLSSLTPPLLESSVAVMALRERERERDGGREITV